MRDHAHRHHGMTKAISEPKITPVQPAYPGHHDLSIQQQQSLVEHALLRS
jgi:hypothetical protein